MNVVNVFSVLSTLKYVQKKVFQKLKSQNVSVRLNLLGRYYE